ncbi:hypothetical protein ABZ714_06265 [Streptomyces sp. NPDC006798]|uniref:hypothetical protein n=1 Tax=Streptomyces sp. NPDC006798 TaxID=3155462 RepID=UPI0034056E36
MKQTLVGLTAAAGIVAFGPTASAATTSAPTGSGTLSAAAPDCSRGVGGGSEKYGWTECTGLGTTQRVRVEIWCGSQVHFGAWVHNGKRSVAYCPTLAAPDRVYTDFR